MTNPASNTKEYKSTILLNIFFRNFAVTFVAIYSTAEFLTFVGKDSWPLVFQFTQYFSISFVFVSVFLNRRNFFRFYHLIVFIFLVALSLYHFYPQLSSVIIFLTVMSFVIDTVGDLTSSNAVMRLLSSIQYKQLSPRIVLLSSTANVSASLSVIIIQHYGNQTYFVIIAFISIVLNFITYNKIINVASTKFQKVAPTYKTSSFSKIIETTSFTLKNPLVVMAFALMIWSTLVKFCSGWIYVSSASDIFTNAKDLSTFLGIANLSLMGIVIFFQQFLTPKIVKKLSPATLLSLIPFLFLIFGVIGVSFKSSMVGIALNILFLIIYKTVHMPTLKVCMQSIPNDVKSKVFLLLSFIISSFMLLMTATMAFFKNFFSPEIMYFSLVILSIIAIIIILKFDVYYLKNLWDSLNKEIDYSLINNQLGLVEENTKEEDSHFFNPHHYFIHPYKKSVSSDIHTFLDVLKYFPYDNSVEEFWDCFRAKQATAFEQLILVSNVYLFTKNIETFKQALVAHRQMYHSIDIETRDKALHLFSIIAIDQFQIILKKLALSDAAGAEYSSQAISLNKYIDQNDQSYGPFKNGLRIFTLLNLNYLTPKNKEKIQIILRSDNAIAIEQLMRWLSYKHFITLKHDILRSFDAQKMSLDVSDFLNRYYTANSKKRSQMQSVLRDLHLVKREREILKKQILTRVKAQVKMREQDVIDFLYLIEWAHLSKNEFHFTLNSFKNYEKLQENEKESWIDFHIEYMKKIKQPFMQNQLNIILQELYT